MSRLVIILPPPPDALGRLRLVEWVPPSPPPPPKQAAETVRPGRPWWIMVTSTATMALLGLFAMGCEGPAFTSAPAPTAAA